MGDVMTRLGVNFAVVAGLFVAAGLSLWAAYSMGYSAGEQAERSLREAAYQQTIKEIENVEVPVDADGLRRLFCLQSGRTNCE